MSDSAEKIHLLDAVGLSASVTQRALVAMGYEFEYHRFKRDWDTFRASMSGVFTPVNLALLVDLSLLHRAKTLVPRMLHRSLAIVGIGSAAEIEEMGGIEKILQNFEATDILESPISATDFAVLLHRLAHLFHHQKRFSILQRELTESQNELQKISDIGAALSSEEDTEALLDLILTSAMEITGADAGSLYIVEEKPGAQADKNDYLADKQLRFRYAKNYSRDIKLQGFTMPITPQSIVGYVTISREPLSLPDVYFLPEGVPFKFGGRQTDAELGYRTKSMLTVPMLNRDREPIGVIQLINKKKDFRIVLPEVELWRNLVYPFTRRDELFVYSLASQAGIAYENRLLYDSIKALFEGFIRASVTAIEARDPTTSGHSERVASLTVSLAETVSKIQTGPFRDVKFSKQDIREIEYAALLHDFGKIGVREPVLVKAKKLYDHELREIENRYAILRKAIELKAEKRKVELLLEKSRQEALPLIDAIDREVAEKLRELDDYLRFILQTNEPTVLKSEGFGKLEEIKSKIFVFGENEVYPYLTEAEARRLSIPKGSLDEQERQEINSHVTHTYNFLKQIPWTRDLRNVPLIAYSHHEKLDGSGYPRQVREPDIPIQSRMMTIADIYDALTAQDRPYKKAVPVERALDILRLEVKDHRIDKDLFDIFVQAKIYEVAARAER
ncbi:MAG: GAF domain-containing protein [Chloroherpetonaceae bacterium]|nr:GAF domain-containing protein [Chloroherpetonaceae bacterium]MDW8438746.1 HD domain-containing phosphohydrolase [Chloroherpetonaceae bacterium]